MGKSELLPSLQENVRVAHFLKQITRLFLKGNGVKEARRDTGIDSLVGRGLMPISQTDCQHPLGCAKTKKKKMCMPERERERERE